jgi:hypothetical protein
MLFFVYCLNISKCVDGISRFLVTEDASSCHCQSMCSHRKDTMNIKSPFFQDLEGRPASPKSDTPNEMIHGSSCHYSPVKVSLEQVAENVYWRVKAVIEFCPYSSDVLCGQLRIFKHWR